MDLIFRDDTSPYKETTAVPGNNNERKLHAYQSKLPKRLFFFLGLYHKPNEGPCDVFLPSDSAKAAYKLFSCIECTAFENKTEQFCIQIAEYLLILAQFNDNIYKRRNAYPYSEALMDLIRIYIELEYESLYGNESFMNVMAQLQATNALDLDKYGRESTVKRRVMDTLSTILPCCYDYRHDLHHGMQPFNVMLSRDMHFFQVLKSVNLKYQHKNGFIKKVMKEIIDNNAEMSAVIHRTLKSGQLNSITKVWTHDAISFLTERELHSSLYKAIPEDYHKCLQLYGIEISPDMDALIDDDPSEKNLENSEDAKELVNFLLSDYEYSTHDEFNIDHNSPIAILNARKFLEPPSSISDQYSDSHIPVKLEDFYDDDEDYDSNAQDEGASSSNSSNSCSITPANKSTARGMNRGLPHEIRRSKTVCSQTTTQNKSNTNQSRRSVKPSLQEERIVGSFIIHEDDSGDDKIILSDIVCIADDDDDVIEVLEEECNTNIDVSNSDDATQGKEVVTDSPLAVLAAQAVEKEKVRVISMVIVKPSIESEDDVSTNFNQSEEASTETDTVSSVTLNNTSNKEEEYSSTTEIISTDEMHSSTDLEQIVVDVQNIIDTNETVDVKLNSDTDAITEPIFAADSNIDKADTQCIIEDTDTPNQILSASDESIVASKCDSDANAATQTVNSDEATSDSSAEEQRSTITQENCAGIQNSNVAVHFEPDSSSLDDASPIGDCENVSITESEKKSVQNPLPLDMPSIMDEETNESTSAITAEASINITKTSQKDMPLINCDLETPVTSAITENSLNHINSQPLVDHNQEINLPSQTFDKMLSTEVQEETSAELNEENTTIEPCVSNANINLPSQTFDKMLSTEVQEETSAELNEENTTIEPCVSNANINLPSQTFDKMLSIEVQEDTSAELNEENTTIEPCVSNANINLPSQTFESTEVQEETSAELNEENTTIEPCVSNANINLPSQTFDKMLSTEVQEETSAELNEENTTIEPCVSNANINLPSQTYDKMFSTEVQEETSAELYEENTTIEPCVTNANTENNPEDNMSIDTLGRDSKQDVSISDNLAFITATIGKQADISPCEKESQVETNDFVREPTPELQSEEANKNMSTHLVKVENQLPETIPDVQTGSNLPRSVSTKSEFSDTENQTISTDKDKLSQHNNASKLNEPQSCIVKNKEKSLPTSRNSLGTKTNRNDEAPLPSLKDEAAILTTDGSVLTADGHVEIESSNRSMMTKAARKQGIEMNISSHGGRIGTMPHDLQVTKTAVELNIVDAAPREQTSRDPLVCSILPEKIIDEKDPDPETILRNVVKYGLNVNSSSQHMSNDFSCDIPEVLLDMEIQTEQVPTSKEAHEENDLGDETDKHGNVDPSECGHSQDKIPKNHNARIEHKIGPNLTLSIDANMHKSILDCLEPQKESYIWHTNDCTAGFCHPSLQVHVYKNDQSNNVEEEDVEKYLLSGSVRPLDVLGDIRDLDTQQLFEVCASEQCDETMVNESKSVMINNENIKVRIMNPADLSNMVIHPVNLSVPQQIRTEQHANIGNENGLDPLIQVNENTVQELLQISNNTENIDVFQDEKEQEHNMDTDIEIIEAVVTSATVLKNQESQTGAGPVQELLKEVDRFSKENVKQEPTAKVLVEHINNTNMYDTLKSKSGNTSYAQFFTPDEPEPNKKGKKGNKKPVRGASVSSSKSPSQGKTSVPSPVINSFNSIEEGVAKSAKPNIKGKEKKGNHEPGVTSKGGTFIPNSTFDRLLTEYRGKQGSTSGSTTSKPASPSTANSIPNNKSEDKRANSNSKSSNTNSSEVTTKQSKRNSALSGATSMREKDSLPSTPVTSAKGDTKKGSTSRSLPDGTSHSNTAAVKVQSTISSTDSAHGSPKLNKRGTGTMEATSSSTNPKSSSQSSANVQKNNTRKGNINAVTEMLQQQQQENNRNQQQKTTSQNHPSPACDTDYEELEEQIRRDRNKRPANSGHRPNPTILNNQQRPQHMMYPLLHGAAMAQQQTKQTQHSGNRQQDGLPRHYFVPPPQMGGHNPEFRPWEAPHIQHDLAGQGPVYRPGLYVNMAQQPPPLRPPQASNWSGQQGHPPYPNAEAASTMSHSPPIQEDPVNSTNNNDYIPSQLIPSRKPAKKNRDIYRKLFPHLPNSKLPEFWPHQ